MYNSYYIVCQYLGLAMTKPCCYYINKVDLDDSKKRDEKTLSTPLKNRSPLS